MVLKPVEPNILFNPIEHGKLTNVQLEAVAYAEYCHNMTNSFGERVGYMLGFNMGVGKGRTGVGMYLNGYGKGRRVGVWVSKNPDLMRDAKRDAAAVGMNADVMIRGLPSKRFEERLADGFYFTTFSSLLQEGRVDWLIERLGADFDGLLFLDESHLAGGVNGKFGKSESTKTGRVILKLLDALPQARVVFSSGTAAQEPKHFRLMARRIGLYGTDAPFEDADALVAALEAGGLPLQEELIRWLATERGYRAPRLSWDGVTFEVLTHTLTQDQRELWDSLAVNGWQAIYDNLKAALGLTNQAKSGLAAKYVYGHYMSAKLRFYANLMPNLMVPTLIKRIEQDLAAGRSVVVQVATTGAAALKRRMAEAAELGLDLDDVDFSDIDHLMELVNNAFPIHEYSATQDSSGQTVYEPLLDDEGEKQVNLVALEKKERLLTALARLKVPSHALDQLIWHFGQDAVAEITGRNQRVVLDANGRREIQTLSDTFRATELQAFQDGKKRIIVLSPAGSTGISTHSSIEFKNQQERRHYALQLNLNTRENMQVLHRSHRTGQVVPPGFILMQPDVMAYRRILIPTVSRIKYLGANSCGQADAANAGTGGEGGQMFTDDMEIREQYGREAVQWFFRDALAGKIEGVDAEFISREMGLRKVIDELGLLTNHEVKTTDFMNAVLSLTVNKINHAWEEFWVRYEDSVNFAKEQGTYEEGIKLLRAKSVEIVETKPIPGMESSKFAKIAVEIETKPRYFDKIPFSNSGLIFARDTESGALVCAHPGRVTMVTATGQVEDGFKVYSPHNYCTIGETEFSGKYKPVERTYELWQHDPELMVEWNKAADNMPPSEIKYKYFILGKVLPLWQLLPDESRGNFFRIPLKDGEVIGLELHQKKLSDALTSLGVDSHVSYPAEEVAGLLENGNTIRLQGNVILKTVRRANDKRWLITGLPEATKQQYEKDTWIRTERQNSYMQSYVPVGNLAALTGITKKYRVVSVE